MSNAIKKERLEVPIWHKPFLTIEEATAYTGIGRDINLAFLFIKTLRNFIYDTKNHQAQGRKVVLIFCSE